LAEGCVVCSANYLICNNCSKEDGWMVLNGDCVLNTESSFITYGFWDPGSKIVRTSFNFVPEYYPTFDAVFKELYIVDVKTGSFYNASQLNGTVTKTLYGFTIKFKSNETILSGLLTIPRSNNYRILDRDSRLVFDNYPIQVEGVYLVPPTTSSKSAVSTMNTASQSRSLLTLAIFSFNPMVAVALDYMFSELFVLKLYEGPFLAYPELILKTSTESTILPIQLPNYFQSNIDENACVPSDTFQMNNMNCVFLDNYGNDIQSLFLIFAMSASFSILGWLFRLCLKPETGQAKGRFLAASDFIALNYGLQLFHAKMEGEKLEVMVHLMLGMTHRKESILYMPNLFVMSVLQIYYFTVAILAVSFSAEVGRFLTRSPIILTLLREHNKKKVEFSQDKAQTDQDLQPTVINKLILIEDVDSEGLQNPNQDQKGPITSLPSPKKSVSGQEQNMSNELLVSFTPKEGAWDGNNYLNADKITPIKFPDELNTNKYLGLNEQNMSLGEIESSTRMNNQSTPLFQRLEESRKKYGLKCKLLKPEHKHQRIEDGILLKFTKHTVHRLNSIFFAHEVNLSPSSIQSPRFLLDPKLESENKNTDNRIKQMGRFVRRRVQHRLGIIKIGPDESDLIKRLPEDFRPEAKEYFEFEAHTLAQFTFFVADNTITKNKLYRFAPLASFFRATFLGLIITKLVGDPTTQVSCGLVVEVVYLTYLVNAKYKSSLLEHWVEVVLQSLQVSYLIMKILSIFTFIPDELKQDYLGLPMAVALGSIAGVNIMFVVFNTVMIIWELIELVHSKLKGGKQGDHHKQ
jgi:hypothetical protein